MKYDFDEYVSREKTDSLTVDGWREYLFSGQSEFAMRYPAEGIIVTARNRNPSGSQSAQFSAQIK
ncbi:hypothetical protein [Klebsiella quasipneumoniae]|uniref:hypothetical protein n=1 Tax=Klebsiella quasipneumoniae TaxID=1463165 RepID=UPI003C7609C3